MTLPVGPRRALPVLLPVLLLGAAVALAGCTGSSPAGPDAVPEPDRASVSASVVQRYVALGDSYTSAPYVGRTDLAQGCLRSEQNYPKLFAAEHDVVTLVDVSCAGATTRDLVSAQRPFGSQVAVPPQLDAVTPDTDLVTLGIGGNDTGLFGRLARDCARPAGRSTRQEPRAGSCVAVDRADLARIGRSVTHALRLVQQKAPDATVVLVGYPRLLDGRTCPDRVAVRAGDVAALSRVVEELDGVLRAAARRTGTEYADVRRASAGHDICSADPWVNGSRNRPGKAAALHPFATEQEAVARLLAGIVLD